MPNITMEASKEINPRTLPAFLSSKMELIMKDLAV